MAAITPTSVRRYSIGNVALVRAVFANTADDGDTWASAMKGVVGFWTNVSTDPTQTKEGMNVSESSGTFTFNLPEDNLGFELYVMQTA